MPKVKVWNDNIHDLNETFKGDKLHIPAKSYIEMDLFEANDYKGQYLPIMKDASGLQDPRSFKMVRIEKISDEKEPAQEIHVCMSCKHKSPSKEELAAHITVRHADAALTEIPEMDEKLKKTGKKAS